MNLLNCALFLYPDATSQEELCKALKNLGTDAVHVLYNEGKGLRREGADYEWVRRLVELCHKEGIKVFGRISCHAIHWTHLLKEEPMALDWTARSKYGIVLIQFSMFSRFVGCQLNQDWINYLKRAVKRGIEDGLDGIWFDNMGLYHCFCKAHRELFAQYTLKKLGRRCEIPEEFDFKGEVSREFVRFHNESYVKFHRELSEYAKSIKKDFLISSNMNPPGQCPGQSLKDVGQVLDYIYLEAGYGMPYADGRDIKHNTMNYLFAKATNPGKPIVLAAYPRLREPTGIPTGFLTLTEPRSQRLALAEAKIFGASFLYLYNEPLVTEEVSGTFAGPFMQQNMAGNGIERVVASLFRAFPDEASGLLKGGLSVGGAARELSRRHHLPVIEAAVKYNRFFKENAENYAQDQYVDVALLCSIPTFNWHYRCRNYEELYGSMQVLLDSSVMFTLITDEQLSSARERGAQLLILPDSKCLSDDTINLVRSFRASGGNVLATGETGRYAEEYAVRGNLEEGEALLHRLFGQVDEYSGKLVYLNELGIRYLKERRRENLDPLRSRLLQLHSPLVKTPLPWNVFTTAYQKDSMLIVHLLNYDEEIKKNVILTVARKLVDLQVKTPDEVEPEPNVTSSKRQTTIDIKELDIYTIIIGRMM